MKRASRGGGQKRNYTKRKQQQQLKCSLVRPLKSMFTKTTTTTTTTQDSSIFQKVLEDTHNLNVSNIVNYNVGPTSAAASEDDSGGGNKDCILSQDFFCTPDYITPECQNHLFSNLDSNKENIPCPNSPEKLKPNKKKRFKNVSTHGIFVKSPDSMTDSQQTVELSMDTSYLDEVPSDKTTITIGLGKGPSYVSQSAVALRCRVMPPPCLKNPYLKDASEMDIDPFGSWRTKCSGLFSASSGAVGGSRYRTDFQEIEQIGNGNFSRVFKALKRIDGCMYAVKHSTRQLRLETERRKALMEVQALAALGFHENIVAYHTSWFEDEKLYIQMELCDCSLSIHNSSCLLTEDEALAALYQIAKALKFIHERGIAHLDVKPDNIYVKHDIYKLGDFGCATLLDKSQPIEEGDARYMPQEILNEKFDHLDKVDIFSLGASIYELLRGSLMPDAGFQLLREGKLQLLPSNSVQLQNLLKVMVDPDPTRRPSAKELVENPIFARNSRTSKIR